MENNGNHDQDNKIIPFLESKAQEELMLVGDDERRRKLLIGQLSVLRSPLTGMDGVITQAKDITDVNENIKDQLISSLLLGAATTMTACILGYEKPDIEQEDLSLWNGTVEIILKYYNKIFNLREELNLRSTHEYIPETSQILNIVEFALYQESNNGNSDDYINEVAAARTLAYTSPDLNIANLDRFNLQMVEEVRFLTDMIAAYESSHGKKNITYIED